MAYVRSTGCQWRVHPTDLPPQHGAWLSRPLEPDGTLERIHHALYVNASKRQGEASPTVAIIDSRSVKALKKGVLHRP
ncbi:hypothetical protein JDN41_01170 [Rhodomicrobium udaipurense]|uniref:Transposase n=1 Tax=Rhodomicrobium udaipurense TaxID=1202716 RepID=A0A8I1GG04_9HYPH|nr:hypothetical protein [Rhodomicrobium udaipurense]